jgi:2-aminoadipate transaminase
MRAVKLSAALPALARRTRRTQPSAVREILKVAEQPDVLSFAGGLPAPELFPLQAIADAHALVFAREGAAALQYSTTEGFGPLREWIAADLRRRGVESATADTVLVTAGSQQGIDLAARVLLDPNATVVVESPSYLAALQVFAAAEAKIIAVGSDDQGMDVADLAKVLARNPVRLIYLVPNFQNPKGTTLSAPRRHALVSLAQAHGVPILEDDPYGELRFRGEALSPLAALDSERVLSLGTFSKTLAPGLRLGWVHGPTHLLKHLVVAKQSTDLHSSSLSQRAVAALFETFDYKGHLSTLRRTYGERCDAMRAALERAMPEGTRLTRPDGGLFIWAELPGAVDAEALLKQAVAHKVAFVPGAPFFAEAPRRNTLRLNFSNRPPERIAEGIARLGDVIRMHWNPA